MKKSTKDIIIIGFALFAMFFGAGNLIFPPYLGNIFGSNYILSAVGFILTGVGLPLLGIIACTKVNGDFENIGRPVGPIFTKIFSISLFLTIGPLLAIPRTAATTYELAIFPVFPKVPALAFVIFYFALNLVFVLNPSQIMDLIGKYLTPILLITLSILIVKGIFWPVSPIIDTGKALPIASGLKEGYQTMDALAALVFSSIVFKSILAKGYGEEKVMGMTLKSGAIAIIGLALVYSGLMHLGAQTSSVFGADVSKTFLLLEISQRNLGSIGSILIGVAIGVACFTTSVGLISSGSSFFEDLTNGRLPYKFNAVVMSIIGVIIGSSGVEQIVKFAGPILNILYPMAITLIILTLIKGLIKNNNVFKVTVYTSLLFSILSTISSVKYLNTYNIKTINLLTQLPLYDSGFVWVIPTIVMFIVSFTLLNNSPTKSTIFAD
ncbi:branched-chain amino acid transport system II carrier protein [Clostridium algidicarnis]|uniref:branched-chain amino acid transport system II carrier protein n=1 Tax=Clostridium algidicarnis TaxID=37659 RepID=UPI001C0DFB8E|nr:branched-chain amino acid transport system II carrier protein [Clostridium algidicarnis]MBU3207150.1 branched-chain amino acid transport system II carrier protein [Clostridium algidicarnis]